MRARTILGSTALHATIACGLGVWVGAFAGSNPRPDVTFGIAYEPMVTYVEREMPDEPVEDQRVEADPPMPEPPAPLPRESEFEAPDAPEMSEELRTETAPDAELLVRIRPEKEQPVEAKPPEPVAPSAPAFVEARARDDRNAPPSYPRKSVRRGESGEVILLLSIDAFGKVTDVTLDTGCGYPRLHQAAIAAAREWVFDPAREDGVAVASTKRVPVEFRIE